jgi:hypothetical protein
VKYDSTRLFAVFFIFSCVLIYAVAFNNVLDEWADSVVEAEHRDKMNLLATDKFSDKWIDRTLPKNVENPTCSKDRFVLSVLAEMGVIYFPHHITPLINLFKEMDVENKGFLSVQVLFI